MHASGQEMHAFEQEMHASEQEMYAFGQEMHAFEQEMHALSKECMPLSKQRQMHAYEKKCGKLALRTSSWYCSEPRMAPRMPELNAVLKGYQRYKISPGQASKQEHPIIGEGPIQSANKPRLP
jgi:hypothetical protein